MPRLALKCPACDDTCGTALGNASQPVQHMAAELQASVHAASDSRLRLWAAFEALAASASDVPTACARCNRAPLSCSAAAMWHHARRRCHGSAKLCCNSASGQLSPHARLTSRRQASAFPFFVTSPAVSRPASMRCTSTGEARVETAREHGSCRRLPLPRLASVLLDAAVAARGRPAEAAGAGWGRRRRARLPGFRLPPKLPARHSLDQPCRLHPPSRDQLRASSGDPAAVLHCPRSCPIRAAPSRNRRRRPQRLANAAMLSWDDEDDCYPESLESLKQVRHGGGGCEALVGDMSMYRRSQPGKP